MAYCWFVLLLVALVPAVTTNAAPDEFDYCVADTKSSSTYMNGFPCLAQSQVSAEHFTTSALNDMGNPLPNRLGFSVILSNPTNLPGVNGLGICMGRGNITVGGIFPPHIHPRGTEIIHIEQGTARVGFVDVNNKLFMSVLKPRDSFVFPKGMLHFTENVGDIPVIALFAFNSVDPGVAAAQSLTFVSNPPIPDGVLAKAFAITKEEVKKIRNGV